MSIITTPGAPVCGEIIVQTRRGTNIPNSQVLELTGYLLQSAKKLESQYPQANFKPNLVPLYNCHGMTFASRRTGIFDGSDVRRILKEDEYDAIERSDVQPGDIIVYFDEMGDVEHSGFVIEKPAAPLYFPKIVSKWGHGPEVIHSANYGPYSLSDVRYFRIKI